MKLDRQSRLITAKHAASELGIPYATLRNVVFRGELAVVKVWNRVVLRQERLRPICSVGKNCFWDEREGSATDAMTASGR